MALLWATPPEWTAAVLRDFDAFLRDHAAAEKKASATALTLVSHYPDRTLLVESLIEVAREELDHFQQVWRLIAARGGSLGGDGSDDYVAILAKKAVRRGSDVYLLDRLLLGSVFELRGCERFGLVAGALPAGALKDFYAGLVRTEAAHRQLYLDLARTYFQPGEVEARYEELLNIEARVAAELPIRAALH